MVAGTPLIVPLYVQYIACLVIFNCMLLFQKDKRSKSGKFLSDIGEH